MYRIVPILLAGLLLAGCASGAGGELPTPPGEQLLRFTGTVVYLPFEGGFYGLVAEDGSRYDPGDLPQPLRKDGLPVRVTARRLERMVGFHMWGARIEVVEIQPLEKGGDTPH